MSTVIIVDSACELPQKYLNSKFLKIVPVNITLGSDSFRDVLPRDQVLGFVESGRLNPKLYANTSATPVNQIREFLITEIIPHYTFAVVLTVAKARSYQYDNWQKISNIVGGLTKKYSPDKRFSMSIVDSGTAYPGLTLLALESARMARESKTRREFVQKIKAFVPHVKAYSAPKDLWYLRHRAVQRGDNTMSLFSAVLGSMLKVSPILFAMDNKVGLSASEKGHDKAIKKILDHALDMIRAGLQSPIITVSYSGPLQDLSTHENYLDFRAQAEGYGCKVIPSVASLSSFISLGPGNFGVGLAPKNPEIVISG